MPLGAYIYPPVYRQCVCICVHTNTHALSTPKHPCHRYLKWWWLLSEALLWLVFPPLRHAGENREGSTVNLLIQSHCKRDRLSAENSSNSPLPGPKFPDLQESHSHNYEHQVQVVFLPSLYCGFGVPNCVHSYSRSWEYACRKANYADSFF